MLKSEQPMQNAIQFVTRFNAFCGESPIWCADENALYWVDIGKKTIYKTLPFVIENNAIAQTEEMLLPFEVYSIVKTKSGDLLGVGGDCIIKVDFAKKTYESLHTIQDLPAKHRFNDAKLDSHDRLWIGSMNTQLNAASARIYSYSLGQDIQIQDTGYIVANGLAWSNNNKNLYFVETQKRQIFRYTFNSELGQISQKTLFLEFTEQDGKPDGICVDANDNLWVAFWDGHAVKQYNRNGELCLNLPLPVARPTSLVVVDTSTLALEKNINKNQVSAKKQTLFITSAAYGIQVPKDTKQFIDGRLLSCDL